MTNWFWYLATPYAKYPGGISAAAEEAAKQAAVLFDAGIHVFCPISHAHHIAKYMKGPIYNPHRFWLDYDRPFMVISIGLIVCMMKTWDISDGISEEIEHFRTVRKPVFYMVPDMVPKAVLEWKPQRWDLSTITQPSVGGPKLTSR